MKPEGNIVRVVYDNAFSALGRAVWDETGGGNGVVFCAAAFSALGRAVWDETQRDGPDVIIAAMAFSALGRAVWDETGIRRTWPGISWIFQCSRSSRMG